MTALLKNQKQERRSLSFKIAGWAQVALLGWMMAWGDCSSRLEYVAVGTARIDCAIAQPEVPTKGEPSGSERVNPTQCDGYGALPGTTKPSALVAGGNVASQLGWRGHYIDPTGFYYMGARNYAPDSGTFLSPDPLGHSASMDLYSYCDGDPVNQYDADGRFGKGGFDSAAGIVTGTAGLVYNGVGSAAYGLTSLGGLAPNSVSDIYANQWQGLKNTGSGLATLGGQIGSGQFSQVAQELTGGANVSGFYRAGYATVGIASLFAGGEITNLGKLGRASEVADIAGNTSLRFTQVTASPWFSTEGAFAGKTISDVASQLRAGTLTAADVPVSVVGDGLIVNTRSSLALMQAGIPQSQWSLIQGSAKDASEIASRLSKNNLGSTGTDVIRITGSGKGASTLMGSGTIPQP